SHSLAKLKREKEKIDQKLVELHKRAGVSLVMIDYNENKIVIFMNEVNEQNKKIISDVADTEVIRFEQEKVVFEDQALHLGDQIINGSTSHTCSVGFYGKMSSGADVGVTAGH